MASIPRFRRPRGSSRAFPPRVLRASPGRRRCFSPPRTTRPFSCCRMHAVWRSVPAATGADPTIRRSAELRVFHRTTSSTDCPVGRLRGGSSFRCPLRGCPAPRRTRTRMFTARACSGAPTLRLGSPGPAPGSRREKVGKFFKEPRQTMAQSGAAAAVGGALGLETSKPRVAEDDAVFIAEKDRVLRLEQELAIASQKAERVLLQEEKHGDACEFGWSASSCRGRGGESCGHYTEAGKHARTKWRRSRGRWAPAAAHQPADPRGYQQLARALDPLHDYLGMMRPRCERRWRIAPSVAHPADVAGRGGTERSAAIAKLETDITKMLRVDQLKRELAETQATSEAAERARACAHQGTTRGGVRADWRRREARRSRTCGSDLLGRSQDAGAAAHSAFFRAPSRKISARARTSGSTRTRERGRGSIRRRREGRLRRTAARAARG